MERNRRKPVVAMLFESLEPRTLLAGLGAPWEGEEIDLLSGLDPAERKRLLMRLALAEMPGQTFTRGIYVGSLKAGADARIAVTIEISAVSNGKVAGVVSTSTKLISGGVPKVVKPTSFSGQQAPNGSLTITWNNGDWSGQVKVHPNGGGVRGVAVLVIGGTTYAGELQAL